MSLHVRNNVEEQCDRIFVCEYKMIKKLHYYLSVDWIIFTTACFMEGVVKIFIFHVVLQIIYLNEKWEITGK